jgi:hypothetical protein
MWRAEDFGHVRNHPENVTRTVTARALQPLKVTTSVIRDLKLHGIYCLDEVKIHLELEKDPAPLPIRFRFALYMQGRLWRRSTGVTTAAQATLEPNMVFAKLCGWLAGWRCAASRYGISVVKSVK